MPEATYTFVCARCDASMEVNRAMMAALIEEGCVICGTIPSSADFGRDA